jgi:hypothetical protein
VEIHKPKPWHGWREFLKEYLIIVVGVLTALAAEQGVEWLHWRHQAEAARNALRADFERVLTNTGEITAVTPCIIRRIEDVSTVVDQASATSRLPPLGFVGTIPLRGWTLRSWEMLQDSQTLAHIPREEMQAYSQLQLYLINRRDISEQERHTWALLNALAGPGRRFGEAEEAQVRGLLSLSASDASNMATSARLIPGLIRNTHLLSEAEIEAAQKKGRDLAPQAFMCEPIGAPPSVSGGMLERAKAEEARLALPR